MTEIITEFYADPAGSDCTPYLGVSEKNAAFSDKPRPIDSIENKLPLLLLLIPVE